MATIVTDEDFAMAVGQLSTEGFFSVVIFLDRNNRTVLNDATLADITPDAATLESALDRANNAVSEKAAQDTIQASAKTDIENIPNWSTWTASTATAWIDTNVTDLASAKTVLKSLARMVIALRNNEFPDLQE